MKNVFLFVILFGSFVATAQINYALHDSLLLEGYRSYQAENYQQTVQFYKKAFEINETTRISDYLQASHSAAVIKDLELCEDFLVKSVQNLKTDFKSIASFSNDSNYQICVQKIKTDYHKFIKIYYQSITNPETYHAIQDLVRRDQFTRKIGDYYMGVSEKAQEKAFDDYLKAQEINDTVAIKLNKTIMFPKVDEDIKNLQRKVRIKVDSLNILELMAITDVHGWEEEAHLLLWHQRGTYGQDHWVWNYFIPLINNEIEKGTIKPSFWAVFEDHKSIMATGISVYGYHPGKVDPDKVNKNRKSIGLPELTNTEIKHRNNNPYGGRMF